MVLEACQPNRYAEVMQTIYALVETYKVKLIFHVLHYSVSRLHCSFTENI